MPEQEYLSNEEESSFWVEGPTSCPSSFLHTSRHLRPGQEGAGKEIYELKDMGYPTVENSWPAPASLLEEMMLSFLPLRVFLTWISMGSLGSWKPIQSM